MHLLRKAKIFRKTTQTIVGDVILSQEFSQPNSAHNATLMLTHHAIMKIQKNKTKVCMLDSGVRFQLREEKIEGETIYKLLFESDEVEPIEFSSFDSKTTLWLDHLRSHLAQLDYQQFYEMDKLVGSGTFASVYVAKRKLDGKLFAAKAFFKKLLFASDARGRDLIQNEISIMRQLKHPNLINLHEIFESKAQTYLIIDLARGGNLEAAIKQLNGPVPFLAAKVIFRQILEGVKHMHDLGIMHRDLKPGNILFKASVPLKRYGLERYEPSVMVSDFGIASEQKEKLNVYQYCGSPGYMAPEVMECEENKEKTYTIACDIFSLGCVLYQLLTGKMLFNGSNSQEIKRLNQQCRIDYSAMHKDLNMSTSCMIQSKPITCLIKSMLSVKPEERPTVQEILDHKSMQVDLTEDGVPVFKDYNRPKSSPPKHHALFTNQMTQSTPQQRKQSILKVVPLINEEKDKKKTYIRKSSGPEQIQTFQTQQPAQPQRRGSINPAIQKSTSSRELDLKSRKQ